MRRILLTIAFPVCALVLFLSPCALLAEHPIDVQKLSADGNHYEALLAFGRIPQRQLTTEARLAAARSAWALSLPEMAVQEFDIALQDKSLPILQRAQALLARASIEYQEERYRVAPLFADKVVRLVKGPSPLRARAWMIWGESLLETGAHGSAQQYFLKAVDEADADILPDLHYRLGLCALELGELDEARDHFQQVPLNHERTVESIRQLANIALDTKQFDQALFWLTKGRNEYSEDFLDSSVDFALYRSAYAQGSTEKAHDQLENAKGKYPASDEWLTLLNAEAEVSEWRAAMKPAPPQLIHPKHKGHAKKQLAHKEVR